MRFVLSGSWKRAARRVVESRFRELGLVEVTERVRLKLVTMAASILDGLEAAVEGGTKKDGAPRVRRSPSLRPTRSLAESKNFHQTSA